MLVWLRVVWYVFYVEGANWTKEVWVGEQRILKGNAEKQTPLQQFQPERKLMLSGSLDKGCRQESSPKAKAQRHVISGEDRARLTSSTSASTPIFRPSTSKGHHLAKGPSLIFSPAHSAAPTKSHRWLSLNPDALSPARRRS